MHEPQPAVPFDRRRFFRLFTALGDAQRYVDERQAEEQRPSAEVVTA